MFWFEVVVSLKVDGDDGLVIDCEGDVANSYEGSTTPRHAFTWALKTGTRSRTHPHIEEGNRLFLLLIPKTIFTSNVLQLYASIMPRTRRNGVCNE